MHLSVAKDYKTFFYDIDSLAPIDLFDIKKIFPFYQSVILFFSALVNFSSNRLFLSQIPAKTRCITGGITDSMTNITMSEIILYQTGISSSFRQFIAAGMTQHMRMRMRHGSRFFPGGADNAIGLLS